MVQFVVDFDSYVTVTIPTLLLTFTALPICYGVGVDYDDVVDS